MCVSDELTVCVWENKVVWLFWMKEGDEDVKQRHIACSLFCFRMILYFGLIAEPFNRFCYMYKAIFKVYVALCQGEGFTFAQSRI